ncbi:hypothetical protein F2Q68_00039432 [Brassica cretica]|uniref:Uncharacterized protein n=2 Tax=Brassica cretica TaxID=69181 RepID=A0ABQ7AAX1_BRACR|nr:hypothetical protein F2Q68_00039432 [Brassica cretica]KAF3494793.1 hypothetical protein DY000_02053035 [Brassica cretica]
MIQKAAPKHLALTERLFRLAFLYLSEPEPQVRDSERRPERKRTGARRRRGPFPSQSYDEPSSLRKRGSRRHRLERCQKGSTPAPGRRPQPSQHQNSSCRFGRKTS